MFAFVDIFPQRGTFYFSIKTNNFILSIIWLARYFWCFIVLYEFNKKVRIKKAWNKVKLVSTQSLVRAKD